MAAAGGRAARRAFGGIALQQRGLRRIGWSLAALARHQRVGGAADRKRTHQQQGDVTGALRRGAWPRRNRGRDRFAPAEILV